MYLAANGSIDGEKDKPVNKTEDKTPHTQLAEKESGRGFHVER